MAKRDDQTEPETKHPREWAKEIGTPKHIYAGAATMGAHGWIQGVLVTREAYEATIAAFLDIKIGG